MITSKHITLTVWAERNFAPAPKLPTLRAWAAGGMISPTPIKVGRTWMVRQDAEYVVRTVRPDDLSGLSERAKSILTGSV